MRGITPSNRLLWAMLIAGLLAGCGENIFEDLADNDGPAAKIESAYIALNSGDYAGAIVLLEQLCGTDFSNPACDADTAALLASAYSGRAGLDVINLITNASTGGITSFGSVSTLIPAPTAANQADLSNAVTLLSSLPAKTPDQNLQMAVVALADVIVTVGVDLTNGFDTTTGQPNTVPTLTDVNNAEAASGTVTRVSNNLVLITQGVAGSGLVSEDLANDINSVTNGLDANSSSTVDSGELQSYLAGL